MADFEAPSFSLGLDLETQSEARNPTRSTFDPPRQDDSSDNAGVRANSPDEVRQEEIMDSDPEPGPEPTRVLKRLRRGVVLPAPALTNPASSSVKTQELERSSCDGNGDDDIEDFSSQEDLLVRDEHQPAQYNSVCSSSTIPLRGCGVLTTQSSSVSKTTKRELASDAPSSASMETSHSGLLFPKLTVSPLRRFQLLDSDSDSDHPSVSEDIKKGSHKIEPPSKGLGLTASDQKRKVLVDRPQNEDLWKDFCPAKSFHIPTPALDEVCEEYFQSFKNKNAASIDAYLANSRECHATASTSEIKKGSHKIEPPSKGLGLTASDQKRKVLVDRPQNEDLWKDFCPAKSFHIPTPALDEVCEEYFQSFKNKNAASIDAYLANSRECHATASTSEIFKQCWDSTLPLPPSHRYFFHDDPRIQKLVRSRLPNFSPLGIVASIEKQQPCAPVINYMSQFSNGESSKPKGTQKINSKKSSTRGRNKSKKSNASEGWVDPKSSSTAPKDAGKRRVRATTQSAGHWYTSPEGRKVYISRSGLELSGQTAYRQYRKENGAGFRKSKNKTSGKRKRAKS